MHELNETTICKIKRLIIFIEFICCCYYLIENEIVRMLEVCSNDVVEHQSPCM